jgi:hypothetical protein
MFVYPGDTLCRHIGPGFNGTAHGFGFRHHATSVSGFSTESAGKPGGFSGFGGLHGIILATFLVRRLP